MIFLKHNDIQVSLNETHADMYKKHFGSVTEIDEKYGFIYQNWEHEQGIVITYFLITFDLIEKETVEKIWTILANRPSLDNPIELIWIDGSKHLVVFADELGDSKCEFKESFKSIDGEVYYKGSLALRKITKE